MHCLYLSVSAVLVCPEWSHGFLHASVQMFVKLITHTPQSSSISDIWLQHNGCVSTSLLCLYPYLPNTVESQLPELRQFLVPCVKCHLALCLPVGVWGTLLSGVGAARQLEQLRVHMWGNVSVL